MKNVIKDLMRIVKKEYSIDEYVRISGDRYLKHIPENLRVLWYSDNMKRIATCNMEYYFDRYRTGLMTTEHLVNMMTGLVDDFAHEFELISKSR